MGISTARVGELARRWARHLESLTPQLIDASLSIADLRLPERVYAALKRHGLGTVGDLLAMDEEALLAIRNFGDKALAVVVRTPAMHGLSLSDSRGVMVFIGAEQYSSVRAIAARESTTVEMQIERLIDCAAKSSEASGDVQPGR